MTVTIYHNPACGTSRNVLGLIREAGETPQIIEYLKTPPSRAELADLIRRMGIPVRDVLRQKGAPYEALGLGNPDLTDDQLLDAMLAHPILINRPIVVTPLGVKLCRPSETVLELLPAAGGPPGMSLAAEAAAPPRRAALGPFERYLTLWVALCIIVGIALGALLPGPFRRLAAMEVAQINIPVALLIWAMIVPMLLRVDFAAMGQVARHWRGMAVTLGVNWLVKPFSMALLGWLFIGWLFRPWLPENQIDSYIAGLILLAAAPCTAMVFVWSRLTDGEPNFTLSQVALNDAIMVVAFAPVVGLLLGLSAITVPWGTLLLSVVLYIIVPVIAAQLWRRSLLAGGGVGALDRALKALHPLSLAALLTTLVLLFGFQGQQILAQPLVILLLAVPILIQVYLNAGIAYVLNRQCGSAHSVAGPSALIGASNFFELAVAAAISLFGFESGAALATVVGVLVEVPVMLSVVHIVMRTRRWYERGVAAG